MSCFLHLIHHQNIEENRKIWVYCYNINGPSYVKERKLEQCDKEKNENNRVYDWTNCQHNKSKTIFSTKLQINQDY